MTTINLFQHSTDVETFVTGQTIFDEGQVGEIMYVVQEGQVSIRYQGRRSMWPGLVASLGRWR